jgi:hypothetical protein
MAWLKDEDGDPLPPEKLDPIWPYRRLAAAVLLSVVHDFQKGDKGATLFLRPQSIENKHLEQLTATAGVSLPWLKNRIERPAPLARRRIAMLGTRKRRA